MNILCAAIDALSGIASSDCPSAAGPAYSFPIGVNTLAATATDGAGNSSTGSTSFAIEVTYGSLRNLVSRLVTQQGMASALNAKLDAAEAAENRGNYTAKAGAIGAFRREVDAQTGKSLSTFQGYTLKTLVYHL